jgi:osmotically-inducible protein OsmY
MMLAAALLAGGLAACQQPRDPGQRQTVGERVDDAALTAKVKTALMKADDVNWSGINVESSRGVVSLSGFVTNEGEIQRAVSAAQKVEGVKSVKNDMHVRPAAKQ